MCATHLQAPGNRYLENGRRLARLAGVGGLLFLGGCCAEALYEALAAKPQVRLPADESPHCYGSEWWYYSGRVATDDERHYSLHAAVFHVPHMPGFGLVEAWMAHVGLLDETAGTFAYDQVRLFEPAAVATQTMSGFDLATPLVQIAGGAGHDHLRAMIDDGRYRIALLLEDERGPVLHGADGYVPFGETEASFYYSRPRMRASGTVQIDGRVEPVTGDLWFDRQWGRDLTNPFLGWDWFSIRLDNGDFVMLYLFRDSAEGVAWGTYVPATGEPRSLSDADFEVVPTATWTSPHSGGTYPAAWEVSITTHDLFLVIAAVADDQEVDASSTTLNVYWEGLCTVAGDQNGRAVNGIAFVELTNYAGGRPAP